jgi:hypothetical protein
MIKIQLPEFSDPMFSVVDVDDRLKSKRGGLYFFYSTTEELLYVGKASNVRSRVKQHINKTGYRETNNTYEISDHFKYVAVVYVDSEFERDIYETFAINTLKPKLNRGKVWTYKSQYNNFRNDGEEVQVQTLYYDIDCHTVVDLEASE